MPHVFEPEWDKALILPNKDKIGYLPKDPNIYLDQSTIYYGASGTGKSTLIRDTLYLLKPFIPNVAVFAPTNDMNETYTGIIPPLLIHSRLSRTKLEKIFENQEYKTRIYTSVNRLSNLRPIFEKIKDIQSISATYYRILRLVEQLTDSARKHINIVSQNDSLSFADKRQAIANTQKKCNKMILEWYKTAITECSSYLVDIFEDDYEKNLIRYININPRLLLVLDDCLSEIVAISGKKKNGKGDNAPSIIDTIFQRGRHAFITIIVAAQVDTGLHPAIRTNSYASIFTEHECANRFMGNKSNAIGKDKQKKAMIACVEIFSNSTDDDNFKKLVYYRAGNDTSFLTYTIADIHDTFRFGSDDLWRMCDHLMQQNANKEKDFIRGVTLKRQK